MDYPQCNRNSHIILMQFKVFEGFSEIPKV